MKELVNDVSVVLEEWRYTDYCTQIAGGGKQSIEATTLRNRNASFIVWSYEKHYQKDLLPSKKLISKWCSKLIRKYYAYAAEYASYLQTTKMMKASTIYNHLDSLSHFFQWVVWHSPHRTRFEANAFEPMKCMLTSCRRRACKERRKERANNTLARKIHERRIPQDGFNGLIQILHTQTKWGLSCNNMRKRDIDKTTYDDYLSLLFAHLYCTVPQGRVGGLSSIKLDQFAEFQNKGLAMTDQFKTRAKYGLQAVVINPEILSLLKIYVGRFRPVAVKANPCDYLWVTYKGERISIVGSFVTRFFEKFGNLHVTTTDLRSLAETTAHRAFLAGSISPAERAAITAINGHSSQVTKDHYIRADLNAEATSGRKGFNRMLGLDDINDREVLWPEHDEAVAPIFGTAHPDFGRTTERASWTAAEISFVGKWCKKKCRSSPHVNRLMAKCLEHIYDTPACHPIFHQRHVLNTGRL